MMDGTNTREDFLGEINNGNPEAIRHLFDRYFELLCLKVSESIQDWQQAKDIVTDSFVQLLLAKKKFSSTVEVEEFLYAKTLNACQELQENMQETASFKAELQYMATGGDDLIERLKSNPVALQAVKRAVDSLPAQRKRIVKLIFDEGLTPIQVAEWLGISHKSVLNQRMKALRSLRLILDQEI